MHESDEQTIKGDYIKESAFPTAPGKSLWNHPHCSLIACLPWNMFVLEQYFVWNSLCLDPWNQSSYKTGVMFHSSLPSPNALLCFVDLKGLKHISPW